MKHTLSFIFIIVVTTFIDAAPARRYKLSPTRDASISSSMFISEYELNIILENPENLRTIQNTDSAHSFVYLYTPPVGDQGPFPSCAAWAMGYCAASILAYDKYNDWNFALRSPAYLYNQYKEYKDTINHDCINNKEKIQKIYGGAVSDGICSWNLLPYDTTSCDSSLITQAMKLDAHMNKISCFQIQDTDITVDTLKHFLRHGSPIVVSIPVTQDFDDMWDDGGVWVENGDTSINRGYHTACIVGYNDQYHVFKVQNSWGDEDGDDGFFWVDYEVVEEGCFYAAFVVAKLRSLSITGESSVCPDDEEIYEIKGLPVDTSIHIHWDYDVISSNVIIQPRPSLFPAPLLTFVGDTTDTIISILHSPNGEIIPDFPPFNPPIFPHSVNSITYDSIYWIKEKQLYLFGDTPIDAVIRLKATISCGENVYNITSKPIDLLNSQRLNFTALGKIYGSFLTVDLSAYNTRDSIRDDYIHWEVKMMGVSNSLLEADGLDVSFIAPSSGDYIISLTDDKGCQDEQTITDTIHINVPSFDPPHPHMAPRQNMQYFARIWHPQWGLVGKYNIRYDDIEKINVLSKEVFHLNDGFYIVVVYDSDENIVTSKKIIVTQ